MMRVRMACMASNISSSPEYLSSATPYSASAFGVLPPLWSRAAMKPSPCSTLLQHLGVHQISPSSLTASRSSTSSAAEASILPRLKSSMSRPWTIEYSPSAHVTGKLEMMPSGTP